MLLNTDLHDKVYKFKFIFMIKNNLLIFFFLKKIHNKMTLTEFIENLKGLNSGLNFSGMKSFLK
jgi:hypothetical protein